MEHRHLRTALAAGILASITLAACGGGNDEPLADPAAGAAARPGYGLVTPRQAADLAADGVTVIDVRTPAEYAEGHIDGALLIDISSPTFAEEIAALDPAEEYLVYCRSDNRSGQAVAFMADLGFDKLWDMDGSVIAYSAAGLPLVG
jgi:phage shock protein E